jgi:hypothetical protein
VALRGMVVARGLQSIWHLGQLAYLAWHATWHLHIGVPAATFGWDSESFGTRVTSRGGWWLLPRCSSFQISSLGAERFV